MIYIISPGGYTSGGPETLHQFGACLQELAAEAKMFYTYSRNHAIASSQHDLQKKSRLNDYGVQVAEKIVDSASNTVVAPETLLHVLGEYKFVRKVVWWLSLSNYFDLRPRTQVLKSLERNGLPAICYPAVWGIKMIRKTMVPFTNLEDVAACFHLYNCEYERRFLVQNGISPNDMLYLCGPLNHKYFDEKYASYAKNHARNNVVLYNPNKGLRYTKKVIEEAKRRKLPCDFVPIENMPPNEVMSLMSQSKVYMDFGDFPGPERLPREAVTMGCNIITSRLGAAANEVDVPIPESVKYETTNENVGQIVDRVWDMLENYHEYYPLYEDYRAKTVGQVLLFKQNAKRFIEERCEL